MDARLSFAAVAAGILLALSPSAGSAPPKAKKALDVCQAKKCEVSVVVGAQCVIYLVPEELGIKEGNKKVKVAWVIDPGSTGNVEFADNGVVFKTNGHEKELDGKLKESAKQYKWENRNELAGAPKKRRYSYGVNVTQDGKACPTYDPTIINDY